MRRTAKLWHYMAYLLIYVMAFNSFMPLIAAMQNDLSLSLAARAALCKNEKCDTACTKQHISIQDPEILNWLARYGYEALCSQRMDGASALACYYRIQAGITLFHLDDLVTIAHEILDQKETKDRAVHQAGQMAPVGNVQFPSAAVLQFLEAILCRLDECCNALTNCCNSTFTAIEDLKNTLTECCAGTFTAIADLKATLTECCGTFTEINDLIGTLTACCSGTFTALIDLKNTLTECCSTITADFQATWTILADLKNTLTECCAGTFTAIADLKNTLTECCAGTFTVLANLSVTATAACQATPISTPTTITQPGIYCLDKTINGQITIDASQVDLDLNGYAITTTTNGVVINSGHEQIMVHNGYINHMTDEGIIVRSDTIGIVLKDVMISDCGSITNPFGVHLAGTSDAPVQEAHLENITTQSCLSGFLLENVHDALIASCHVATCSGLDRVDGFNLTGVTTTSSTCNKFVECTVCDCVGTTTVYGFVFESAGGTLVHDCSAQGLLAGGQAAGFRIHESNNSSLCNAHATSIAITETNNSVALQFSQLFAAGISIDDSVENFVNDCVIMDIGLHTDNATQNMGVFVKNSSKTMVDHLLIDGINPSAVFSMGIGLSTTFASTDRLLVKDSSFTNFKGHFGVAGIFVVGGDLTCKNCLANSLECEQIVVGFGGSLANNAVFKDCEVSNITSTGDTGISEAIGFFIGSGNPCSVIENCQAIDIDTTATFGTIAIGMLLDAPQTVMKDCTLSCITGLVGGGVIIDGHDSYLANNVVNDCTFKGISIDSLNIVVENCHVITSSLGISVGGLNNKLLNSSVENCSDAAVFVSGSDAIVDGCIVLSSSVGVSNSGINSVIANCFASKNGTNYINVSNIVGLGAPTLAGENIDADLTGTGGCCQRTTITASMIITETGSYCLSATLDGPIEIATSDVSLDLNGYIIGSPTIGIAIGSNLENIVVRNGQIRGANLPGIVVSEGCHGILLEDLIISHCSFGLSFPLAGGILLEGADGNEIVGCVLNNILIHECASGITLLKANACTIQSCNITTCTNESIFTGFFIAGDCNRIVDCQVSQCSAGGIWGLLTSRAQGLVIDNFLTCSLSAFGDVFGISIDDGTNGTMLNNCEVAHLSSFGTGGEFSVIGIRLNSANCTARGCGVFELGRSTISTGTNIGVHVTDAINTVLENVIVSGIGMSELGSSGFEITDMSDGAVARDCTALAITGSLNAVGFKVVANNAIIDSCETNGILSFGAACGFDLGSSGTQAVDCSLQSCQSLDIVSFGGESGVASAYNVHAQRGLITDCLGQDVTALDVTSSAYGISALSSTSSLLIDSCIIHNIQGSSEGLGIELMGNTIYLRDSISNLCTTTAIDIAPTSSLCIIENCRATNAVIGINNDGADSIIFDNFAADNTTNYVNVLNQVVLGAATITGGNISA